MADTPDKPTETIKPAATRRRTPRKTTAASAAGTVKTRARSTAKRVATKTAAAAEKATTAAAKAERSVVRSVKPRTSSRPKPTTGSRRPAATHASAPSHKPGKWGFAAIFGGIAAAGATLAAVLSLRGSSRKPETEKPRAPEVAEGRDRPEAVKAD